jgi:hypothetical protein
MALSGTVSIQCVVKIFHRIYCWGWGDTWMCRYYKPIVPYKISKVILKYTARMMLRE